MPFVFYSRRSLDLISFRSRTNQLKKIIDERVYGKGKRLYNLKGKGSD